MFERVNEALVFPSAYYTNWLIKVVSEIFPTMSQR